MRRPRWKRSASCGQRLASELGIGVSAQTAALVGQLRRPPGRPGDVGRNVHRGSAAARARGRASRRAHRPGSGLRRADPGLAGRAEWLRRSRAARRRGRHRQDPARGGTAGHRARRTTPDATVIARATAAGPGRAAPFALWTDALSDLVSMTGTRPRDWPGPPTWPGSSRRWLTEKPAPVRRRDEPDPQLERVQLCEAVVQFLAWVSRQAPVLLAFEDLHLADPASLELIAYAGRRLSRLPVLLILTRRRLPARQDLDAVLGSLRSRGALVAEVSVRPLADDAIRAVIKATADLPATTVEQIVHAGRRAARCSPSRPPASAAPGGRGPHRWPQRRGPAGDQPPVGPGPGVRGVPRPPPAATWTAARSRRCRCRSPPARPPRPSGQAC